MQSNNYYWNGKEARAKEAKEHTKFMEEMYTTQIENSVLYTALYSGEVKNEEELISPRDPEIKLLDADTVSALIEESQFGDKVTILNFASYTNPGGMFIKGSRAQEESLCAESFLYNVLKQFPDYYDYNKRHRNDCLYENRALYSPGILFKRGDVFRTANVITCAAPNFKAAQKYYNISAASNRIALVKRCEFVLKIADANYTDILILGAFGCGVFGQDPKEVAHIFKYFLSNHGYDHQYHFTKVIFAIPKGFHKENYEAFKSIFG